MSEVLFLIHQSCKRRNQSGLADLLKDIYVSSPHTLLFLYTTYKCEINRYDLKLQSGWYFK